MDINSTQGDLQILLKGYIEDNCNTCPFDKKYCTNKILINPTFIRFDEYCPKKFVLPSPHCFRRPII